MSYKILSFRDQKAEAQHIKSQLALRWNTIYGCYEVYTTIHGSGVFRWFKISEVVARWYHDVFGVDMPDTFQVELTTGEMLLYPETALEK